MSSQSEAIYIKSEKLDKPDNESKDTDSGTEVKAESEFMSEGDFDSSMGNEQEDNINSNEILFKTEDDGDICKSEQELDPLWITTSDRYGSSESIEHTKEKKAPQSILKDYNNLQSVEKEANSEPSSLKTVEKPTYKTKISTDTGKGMIAFCCDVCPYRTHCKSEILKHLLLHVIVKTLYCEFCSFETTQRTMMKIHMLNHSSCANVSKIRKVRCFKTDDELSRRYVPKAAPLLLFSCQLCSFKAEMKKTLRNHTFTDHSRKKTFCCDLCVYKTDTKSNFKSHWNTHSGDKQFACDLCPYRCKSKPSMRKHNMSHTSEKPFACSYCPFKTRVKTILAHHTMTHTGEKPFACKLCPYKSTTLTLLRMHHLMHTGEKQFSCDMCSYRSSNKRHLKTHYKTHTDEKPFACNVCSYRTHYKTLLKTHCMIHTGERPFCCDFCPYKSTTKVSLRNHNLCHDRKDVSKRFACDQCSFSGGLKINLDKHYLLHTK